MSNTPSSVWDPSWNNKDESQVISAEAPYRTTVDPDTKVGAKDDDEDQSNVNGECDDETGVLNGNAEPQNELDMILDRPIAECFICFNRNGWNTKIQVDCKKGCKVCRECVSGLFESALKDESCYPPWCCGAISIGPFEDMLDVERPGLVAAYKNKLERYHTDARLRRYCGDENCRVFLNPDTFEEMDAARLEDDAWGIPIKPLTFDKKKEAEKIRSYRVFLDPNDYVENTELGQTTAECPKCAKTTCVVCMLPATKDESHCCVPLWQRILDEIGLGVHDGIKVCPFCQRRGDKEEGWCNETTCLFCGGYWCWVCCRQINLGNNHEKTCQHKSEPDHDGDGFYVSGFESAFNSFNSGFHRHSGEDREGFGRDGFNVKGHNRKKERVMDLARRKLDELYPRRVAGFIDAGGEGVEENTEEQNLKQMLANTGDPPASPVS